MVVAVVVVVVLIVVVVVVRQCHFASHLLLHLPASDPALSEEFARAFHHRQHPNGEDLGGHAEGYVADIV